MTDSRDPAPSSSERMQEIRGRLQTVQEVARMGELNVLNSEHHARWDDIEYLLDLLASQASRITALEQMAQTSSEKHRSISEKAGMLRDALVDLTDDDTFATPVVQFASHTLAEYDRLVYGDSEFSKGEVYRTKELLAAAESQLTALSEQIRALIEQWRKASDNYSDYNNCADELASLLPPTGDQG